MRLNAKAALQGFTRQMQRLPAVLRKTLGWKIPQDAMAKERAAFRSNIALEPLLPDVRDVRRGLINIAAR